PRAGRRGPRPRLRPAAAGQHGAGHDGRGGQGLRPAGPHRGLGRHHPGTGPRGRRDRGRLPGRRRDHPLGPVPGHRPGLGGLAVLLAVDVGNTEITIGVFQGDELAQHWRAATGARRTAAHHAPFLGGGGVRLGGAGGVVVSPVVPRLTQALREMVRRYCHVEPLVIEPGIRTGLPILPDNPREVGADRVVNAIAAYAAYGGPVVVVDFGTATTFDAVSERGEHLGAAIAPGIQISMNALGERPAQLRRVELVPPRSVIGKNTVESLQAGAIWGFAGQVDGIVRRMVAELGGSATVVATGGLGGGVLDAREAVQRHEPWLTLHGLRIIWDRNLDG